MIAGIAPINVDLLRGHLPLTVMCIFFLTYTNAILGSSNLVTGMDPITCGGDSHCTSVFLPGGVFNSRRVIPGAEPNLNLTLFSGDDLFSKYPALLIHNAPGYHVEFTPIDENFTFFRNDCSMFAQGLYLCIASYEAKIVAGELQIHCFN